MEKLKIHLYKNRLSFRNKIGRLAWNIVCLLLFKPAIGKYLNFWRVFLLRMFGAHIGKNCSIASSVRIWAPWNLRMHNFTLIDRNTRCYNPGLIEIHSESIISENVFLCTASHNIHSKEHELVIQPIVIGENVWIAADAYINMGIIIGNGAIVAARAVVVKNVSDWTIVGGNPASIIGNRVIQ